MRWVDIDLPAPDASRRTIKSINNVYDAYRLVPGKGQADFATFEDGHCEILICEAILKSAKQKKWVKV